MESSFVAIYAKLLKIHSRYSLRRNGEYLNVTKTRQLIEFEELCKYNDAKKCIYVKTVNVAQNLFF